MLDRLVGRSVFSVAHGIVREDVDSGQLHQRRQPHGRARVIAEDEEARAVSPELGQGEPVHNGSHRMLADTEMEVPATPAISLEISGAGENCFVRWPEIRRATEQPWDV